MSKELHRNYNITQKQTNKHPEVTGMSWCWITNTDKRFSFGSCSDRVGMTKKLACTQFREAALLHGGWRQHIIIGSAATEEVTCQTGSTQPWIHRYCYFHTHCSVSPSSSKTHPAAGHEQHMWTLTPDCKRHVERPDHHKWCSFS